MELTPTRKLAIKDQERVINEATLYALSEREDFCIVGPAGYGKTHVSRQILERICKPSNKILIAALAHNALGIARDFLGDTKLKYKAETLAAAMHCSVRYEGEKKLFVPVKRYKTIKGRRVVKKCPFEEADVILIDECSQVSSAHLLIIEKLRKSNSIIIFIGDMCQLPPIERQDEGELFSPVFNLKTFTLRYPFRYGGELADIGDLFRKQIYLGLESKPFDGNVWKQLQGQKFKSFEMSNDPHYFSYKMLDVFKEHPHDSKYISYTNYSQKKVGAWLRNKITGNVKPFEVKDFIITRDNYYRNNILMLRNGEENEITGKRSRNLAIIWIKNKHGVKQFYQFVDSGYSSLNNLRGLISESLNVDLSRIVAEEISYWSHDIGETKYVPTIVRDKRRYEEILEQLKDTNLLSPYSEYNDNWDAFHDVQAIFCAIQYSYSMTAYTAQGGTYMNSFPSLADIYGIDAKKVSNLQKLQATYVAITRAKTNVLCLTS